MSWICNAIVGIWLIFILDIALKQRRSNKYESTIADAKIRMREERQKFVDELVDAEDPYMLGLLKKRDENGEPYTAELLMTLWHDHEAARLEEVES